MATLYEESLQNLTRTYDLLRLGQQLCALAVPGVAREKPRPVMVWAGKVAWPDNKSSAITVLSGAQILQDASQVSEVPADPTARTDEDADHLRQYYLTAALGRELLRLCQAGTRELSGAVILKLGQQFLAPPQTTGGDHGEYGE